MWTKALFTNNTSEIGLGTMTATFEDIQVGVFNYSEDRIVIASDLVSFALRAKASLATFKEKLNHVDTEQAAFLLELNK